MNLIIIYVICFFVLSRLVAGLFLQAKSIKNIFKLNDKELILTKLETANRNTMKITGLVSKLFVALLPHKIGVFTDFVYTTIPISMLIVSTCFKKKDKKREIEFGN